jgi:DNA topoisomerase IB
VTATDINGYLAEVTGGEFTAKDFRTWHATVLAAVGLAVSEHAAGTAAARKRAISRAVAEVAGYLGNTPAVARASYIDPRVIESAGQHSPGRCGCRGTRDSSMTPRDHGPAGGARQHAIPAAGM